MKNFNYTARDTSGALKRGAVQAADREAVLQQLTAQGVVPISIEEGRVKTKQPEFASSKLAPGLLVCIVLALAAFVYWWLAPKPQAHKQAPKVSAQVTQKKTSQPEHVTTAVADQEPEVKESEPVSEPQRPLPVTNEVRLPIVAVTRAPMPQPPARPVRGAQRRLAEAFEKGLPTEPMFKHECESILAFYVRPGEPPSPHPLPENLEEEARKALAENIVVTPDDTDEQAQEKEMVAWMKEDLRNYLANGGTAKSFFELAYERQEKDAALFLEARKILNDYYRAGNTTETLTAHQKLNETLKEQGIAPMPLPGHLRKVTK